MRPSHPPGGDAGVPIEIDGSVVETALGTEDPTDTGVAREALGLPLLLLSIGLAGGLRVDASGLRLVAPPLISLVLALLLLAVLVRGSVLAPERLMSARRGMLANVSGAIVLAALVFASAQVFSTLTPERGFLHLLFNIVFVLLLWNTTAASPDPPHLLRSLMVVLGSAFALKYIVLSALFDPAGGFLKRVLTAMLEGLTLGSIEFVPDAPITGYVALAAVLGYLVALYLLPRRSPHLATPAALVRGSSSFLERRPL